MVVSSTKVAGAGLLSRLAGLVRDMTIGSHFGTTALLDAYFVALSIPTMVWMSVGSTLQNSLVSIYARHVGARRPQEARALGLLVLRLGLILAALLSLAVLITAKKLVVLVAPGLPSSTADIAAAMLRILAPLIIFGLAENWSAGLLNCHGIFGLPAVVGIPRNLAIALLVVVTAGTYHIKGLVWGTPPAFLLTALWLVLTTWRVAGLDGEPGAATGASAGSEAKGASDSRADIRTVLRLAWPVALTDVARRLNVIIDQIIGSGLGVGTIAALAFANRLALVPVGLVGMSVSTVLFPTLARTAGTAEKGVGETSGDETPPAGEGAAVFDLTMRGVVSILLVLAPVVAVLIVSRVAVVDLLFGRGAFTSEAVRTTAAATAYYALAIIPWAWQPLASRAFYALGDSLTPLWAALAGLAVKAAVSWTAAPTMLVGGVALGTAAGATVSVLMTGVLLGRRLDRGLSPECRLSLLKITAAVITGLGAALAALKALGLDQPSGHLGELLAVAVCGSVLLSVYSLLVALLRVPEAERAGRALRRRLGW